MPDCTVTLPPITIPPEPPVPPPGGGGTPIPPITIPPIVLPPNPGYTPGHGNIVYLSTHKGLAVCLNAYGTMGSDGAPVWYSCNGIAPDNLTGGGLIIHAFNLDPWSSADDHFTAGWAVTDDGIWRVTGLPNVPAWTQVLSAADVVSIFGAGYTVWNGFAPSVRERRVLFIVANGYGGLGSTVHPLWTDDDGATFQYDVSQYLFADLTTGGQGELGVYCSYTQDQTYYYTGRIVQYQGGISVPVVGAKITNTIRATVDPVSNQTAAQYMSNDYEDSKFALLFPPYANSSGTPYADDDTMIVGDIASENGVNVFRLYTGFCNPLGNTNAPAGYIGHADMTGVGAWPRGPYRLAVYMWDDTRLYAWDKNNNKVWVSSDRGTTWTEYTTLTFGGRTPFFTNAYPVPVDPELCFFCGGVGSGSGYAVVVFTTDGGVTWQSIDNYGTANAVDTVMGLNNSTDMSEAQIIIDRRFDGNWGSTSGATMIDVSHWNGTMNWATAAGAGVTHTFMKASQGSGYTDTEYATNWAGALAAGINRGAYHYYENATDPTLQAAQFLAVMNGDYGELGPAVDCEDETATLDPADLKIFLDAVEIGSGYKCTIYTRASWWNTYVGHQLWTPNYPLWVANWGVSVPTLPDDWMNWTYWQFSSTGDGPTYGASSVFVDVNHVA